LAQYADDSLKKDKDFALAAVTQNSRALEYAHESLKKDKDFVSAVNESFKKRSQKSEK
jgi:hypothetical protein